MRVGKKFKKKDNFVAVAVGGNWPGKIGCIFKRLICRSRIHITGNIFVRPVNVTTCLEAEEVVAVGEWKPKVWHTV